MDWLVPIFEAAKSLFELGFSPFLIVLFILWLIGKLHTDQEKKDWKELYENERQEKLQALQDRKDSDVVVTDLTERLREHDTIMARSLDLNERLVEEFYNRAPRKRGSA